MIILMITNILILTITITMTIIIIILLLLLLLIIIYPTLSSAPSPMDPTAATEWRRTDCAGSSASNTHNLLPSIIPP